MAMRGGIGHVSGLCCLLDPDSSCFSWPRAELVVLLPLGGIERMFSGGLGDRGTGYGGGIEFTGLVPGVPLLRLIGECWGASSCYGKWRQTETEPSTPPARWAMDFLSAWCRVAP